MSVRLLHLADVHLGRSFAYLGAAAASRRQDLVHTFQRICSIAIDQGVAGVLVSGDLFDTFEPSRVLIEAVQRQMLRLVEARIRVFIIPGEYDGIRYRRSVWRLGAFPNAHVFLEPTFSAAPPFDVAGISFHLHGVAYNSKVNPTPIDSLHRIETGVNIALMHASLDPRDGDGTTVDHCAISRPQLFRMNVDYVALGHNHRRQTYSRGGRVAACYPGTPEGLVPAEEGPRYVALLEFDGGPPTVQFLPVNGRDVRNERLNVTGLSAEHVIQRLQNLEGENVLLSARLVGYPDELLDVDSIKNRLASTFFWLDVDDQTRLSSSDFVERMASEATIAGRFVRAMRRRVNATGDADERALLELALKLGLASLRESQAS